jgi:hypothetical protein
MMRQPNYKQRPFFSVSFRASIAVGSYFVFNVGSCGKQRVGCIIEAEKASGNDHEVKVNIFIPFDEWKLRHKKIAIGEGIAKGLQEIVFTTEISEFLFDRDVEDVAFIFTPEQLKEYGSLCLSFQRDGLGEPNKDTFSSLPFKTRRFSMPSDAML